MRIVFVRYREEDDGAWIATAPVVRGFYAYGDSYDEARGRVEAGLPEFAGEPDMVIAHLTGRTFSLSGETRNPQVTFDFTQSQPRTGFFRNLKPASMSA